MKTIKSVAYLILSIIFFLFLTNCKNKAEITEKKTPLINDEFSGVYEGNIDFSMCCEVFEKGNGYIVFDFSEEPFQILYDGKLIDNFSLEQNVLINHAEYSSYPGNIIGVFEKNNGNQGFLYNLQSAEDDGTAGKSFLRKTGDVRKAKELINKAKDEKYKFDEFWIKFKKALQDKDFQTLSNYAEYPVKDDSELTRNHKLNKAIKNPEELVSRFKLIFTSDFYMSANEWFVFRHEDHYPGYEGTYMFMPNVFIIINKFGDEFKITQIVGPWG